MRLFLYCVPANYRGAQKSIFLASSMQEGVCSQQALGFSCVPEVHRQSSETQFFTVQVTLMWGPGCCMSFKSRREVKLHLSLFGVRLVFWL